MRFCESRCGCRSRSSKIELSKGMFDNGKLSAAMLTNGQSLRLLWA